MEKITNVTLCKDGEHKTVTILDVTKNRQGYLIFVYMDERGRFGSCSISECRKV